MNGFRTARALVLDNDPNEAAPVIQALGSLGVGVLFHTGDATELITTKLSGIRLLVVDMVLENCGATADNPAECASILVGTLDSLMNDDHHPLIVVCWTKHADFKDAFEKAFRTTFPNLRIGSVLVFEKDKFLREPQALLSKIRDALGEAEPFSLLLDWEQQVHDAATMTTSELSRHICNGINSSVTTWSDIGFQICACLAVASRGTRVATEEAFIVAASLFEALNPILLDRLETGTTNESISNKNAGASLVAAVKAEVAALTAKNGSKAKSLVTDDARFSLNSLLHLAPFEKPNEVMPGNVYFGELRSENLAQTQSLLPSIEWSEVLSDTFFLSGSPSVAIPILLEVTPPCDFAQRKATLSRLLPGYLISKTESKKIPSNASFVMALGPYKFSKITVADAGDYCLVFNHHFLTSTSIANVSAWNPLFRLRQGPLSQVTTNLSIHISRSGMMKV